MRDTALKSHLLKPLADQLARDLAELTTKRIEAALEGVAAAPAPTTPESAPAPSPTNPAKLPLAGRRPCGCAGRGPHRTSCELATKRKARSLGLIGLSRPDRRSIIAERARRQQAEAEAHKREGALPEPVASFERQAPGGSFLDLEPEGQG